MRWCVLLVLVVINAVASLDFTDCRTWSLPGPVSVNVSHSLSYDASCNAFLSNASTVTFYCGPNVTLAFDGVRMAGVSFVLAGPISDPTSMRSVLVSVRNSFITTIGGVAMTAVLGLPPPTKLNAPLPKTVTAQNVTLISLNSSILSFADVQGAALSVVVDTRIGLNSGVTVSLTDVVVVANQSQLVAAGGAVSATGGVAVFVVTASFNALRCSFTLVKTTANASATPKTTDYSVAVVGGVAVGFSSGSGGSLASIAVLLDQSTATATSLSTTPSPTSCVAGVAWGSASSTSLVLSNFYFTITSSVVDCFAGKGKWIGATPVAIVGGVATNNAAALTMLNSVFSIAQSSVSCVANATLSSSSAAVGGIAAAVLTADVTLTNVSCVIVDSTALATTWAFGALEVFRTAVAAAGISVSNMVTLRASSIKFTVASSTVQALTISNSYCIQGGSTVGGIAVAYSADLYLTNVVMLTRRSVLNSSFAGVGPYILDIVASRFFGASGAFGVASGRSTSLHATNVTAVAIESQTQSLCATGAYCGSAVLGFASGLVTVTAVSVTFAVVNSAVNCTSWNGGAAASIAGIAVGYGTGTITTTRSLFYATGCTLAASASSRAYQGEGSHAASAVVGIAGGIGGSTHLVTTNVTMVVNDSVVVTSINSSVGVASGSSAVGIAQPLSSSTKAVQVSAARSNMTACVFTSTASTLSCGSNQSTVVLVGSCCSSVTANASLPNISLPDLTLPFQPATPPGTANFPRTVTQSLVPPLRVKTSTTVLLPQTTPPSPSQPTLNTTTPRPTVPDGTSSSLRNRTQTPILARTVTRTFKEKNPHPSTHPAINSTQTGAPLRNATPVSAAPIDTLGLDSTVTKTIITFGYSSSAIAAAFSVQGNKAVGVSHLVSVSECSTSDNSFPTPDASTLLPALFPLDDSHDASTAVSMALTTVCVGVLILVCNVAAAKYLPSTAEDKSTRASLCEAAFAMWLGYFGPTLVALAVTVSTYPNNISNLDRVVGIGCGLVTMAFLGVTIAVVRHREQALPLSLKLNLANQWSSFYDGARDEDVWFVRNYVFEDLLSAYVINGLGGVEPSSWTGCVSVCVIMCLFAVLHLLYLLIVGPYASRLEGILALINATVTTAVAVLSLASLTARNYDAAVALGVASLVASAYYFISTLVLCAAAVYQIVLSRCSSEQASTDGGSEGAAVLSVPLTMPNDLQREEGSVSKSVGELVSDQKSSEKDSPNGQQGDSLPQVNPLSTYH